jgi:uncharacterized protein YciI
MHFAILIYDEPDSAALRDQYRQTHLDYLKVFDAQTLFAGPFTTDDESADLGSYGHSAGVYGAGAILQQRCVQGHQFPPLALWSGDGPFQIAHRRRQDG